MLVRAFSLTLCFLLTTHIFAKSGRRKGDLKQPPELNDWTGKWFPFDPNQTKDESQSDSTNLISTNKIEDWTQKWFPFKPANLPFVKAKPVCDDGQYSIAIDFNVNDKRHSINYLCLSSNRSMFEPNFALEAILEDQFIPPAFVPPVKCLNESIVYEFPLNTFGAFRPVPPAFGTYIYLPEQRWLHSIAKGAIVMIYHPCASATQVKILQDVLRSCLFRHIITPSPVLSPQRPLALLSWGKILYMSVVDEKRVVEFIKDNAKRGPLPFKTSFGPKSSYVSGLISEAKLITNIEDTDLCGYKEM